MLKKGAVDASRVRADVEATFRAGVPERTPFAARGRTCVYRRDALWFARGAGGYVPLYRTHNTAYGHPRSTRGIARAVRPRPMPPWLGDFLDEFAARHALPEFNHVVLHRYKDGRDTIGMHHDKWMDLAPGSTIACISLGATRRFALGDRRGRVLRSMDVEDGDAVLLSDADNRAMKHAIPPTRRDVGVRYSITARRMRTFYDPARGLFYHDDGPARRYAPPPASQDGVEDAPGDELARDDRVERGDLGLDVG